MTTTLAPTAVSTAQPRAQIRERLQNIVPKLVLAPSFLLV